MKKGKFIQACAVVASVAIAAGAAGCEQTPNKAAGDSDPEQYVTVAEAKEQAQELAGGSIDGIYFPDHVALPDGDSVSTIKLSPCHLQEDDAGGILAAVQGIWQDYGTVDWSSVEPFRTEWEDYWGISLHDQATGMGYDYDSRGMFGAWSMGTDDILTGENCVKSYDFEWGDTAGEDAWELADGECPVAGAVETVESRLNEYLSPLEDDAFTYRVQHLYVMENPDTGRYEYNMSIGRVYEGMSVDTSSHYEFLEDGQYYGVVHRGAYSVAVMRRGGMIDFFALGIELIGIGSADEEESIVSPGLGIPFHADKRRPPQGDDEGQPRGEHTRGRGDGGTLPL